MSFSENEQYVLALSKNKEFVSENEANLIYQKLVSEGNSSTFDYAFEKFLRAECPNCGKGGLFKFHLFGNLKHKECSSSWYISPVTYIGIQLKKSFKTGGNFAGGVADLDERDGKKPSVLGMIFSFVLGLVFRLSITIISIPIQIVFFLINKKSPPIITSENHNE